jgi:hypothetical protein
LSEGTTARRGELIAYRVGFFDREHLFFDAIKIECGTDAAAIEEAHRLDVPSVGAGFEIWHEQRLVHRHIGANHTPSASGTDAD